MVEEIYANVEVTENNGADSSDSENSYEDVFVNQDKLETQRQRSFRKSESSGGASAWIRCYRLTAVCVVLLCVLLLTVLWINYNILKTENIQLKTSYNNLTIERDQLQTSNHNLTIERHQLQTSYSILTLERDQVQRERNEFLRTLCNLGENLRPRIYNFSVWICRNRTIRSVMKINISPNLRLLGVLESPPSHRKGMFYLGGVSMHYVSPHDNDKSSQVVLLSNTQDFIAKQLQGSQAWIGLSDRDAEGEWKWVDGTLLTSGNWAHQQPDNYNNEDCGETGFPDGQHWNDRPCSYKQGWICEKRT